MQFEFASFSIIGDMTSQNFIFRLFNPEMCINFEALNGNTFLKIGTLCTRKIYAQNFHFGGGGRLGGQGWRVGVTVKDV